MSDQDLSPHHDGGRGATKPSEYNLANLPSDRAPSKLPPNLRQLAKHHPLNVLLVEDNRINQKLTIKYLTELGYKCDVADNGKECLELLKKQPEQDYDVILMDLHMPEMDGHETTAKIREIYPHAKQPTIVALTASDTVADTMRCLSHGIEHYLAKPVNTMDIAQVLFKCKPIKPRGGGAKPAVLPATESPSLIKKSSV